jgi:hypothetical protein
MKFHLQCSPLHLLSSIRRQVSRSIGLVMLPCVELTPSPPPAESGIVLVATSGIICDEAIGPRPGRLRLSWVVSSSPSESESLLLCGTGSRSLRLAPLVADPLFPPDRLLLATVTIAFYFFMKDLDFWAITLFQVTLRPESLSTTSTLSHATAPYITTARASFVLIFCINGIWNVYFIITRYPPKPIRCSSHIQHSCCPSPWF